MAERFTWWTAIGMSYGKVDHDHLALVVALWVLPTVGVIADRWRSVERSAQAGWALKCIQISVIFTYFLSALTKIRSGGWSSAAGPTVRSCSGRSFGGLMGWASSCCPIPSCSTSCSGCPSLPN